MTVRDFALRLRALLLPRRVEQELDEELAFHVDRETQRQIARGVSPTEARRVARRRFGSVSSAADGCRDARGTAGVDSLVRDVLYALRTFRHAPLVALTIVATVAIGLALVTVVFTIYSTVFLRLDGVRNPGELYAVERPVAPGAVELRPFTRLEYEAMRRETTVFTDLVAMVRPIRARIDGQSATFALVTGNFFELLGVPAAIGRPLRPDDDGPDARAVIVLSHHGWQELFAGDPAIVGRIARINGLPYEVVGVMPDRVRGLSVTAPDYWAPLGLVGRFRVLDAGASGAALEVVGRLKPAISTGAAAEAFTAWASRRAGVHEATGQFVPIVLEPRNGTLSTDVMEVNAVFMPIFFAFGLILVVGCANVANLQLARGVARQRELGIRLSLGASRRRVVRQLLTESLLLSLVAAGCALGLSGLIQRVALDTVASTLPPELIGQFRLLLAPSSDWRVIAFVFGGAMAATLCFGLAPALQSTRLDLVRSMRGEVMRDVHPSRARHALIGVQVGASAMLLVCAGVLLRSAVASANVQDVRTVDTVMVRVSNEPRRAALLQAVRAHPQVVSVSAAFFWPRAAVAVSDAVSVQGSAGTSRQATVRHIAASPAYFDVLGVGLVSGRFFSDAERSTDASVAVVTETLARQLWPGGSAVGRSVRLELSAGAAPLPPRTLTVVGVLRDVDGPLASEFFPSSAVYVPTAPEAAGTQLMLRVRGDPERTRQTLLDDLVRVDPGLGEITTMRTFARMMDYLLGLAFWVSVALGGLALGFTVSGLFSVLSYLVEQRAKDIGVHMALGATTVDAARLVLATLVRPIAVGLAAGLGLAAAVATILMAASDGEVGRLIQVFDPAAYATSLVILVVSCLLAAGAPVLRASRIDPVVALRQD